MSLIVSRYSTKLRALSDAQVQDFGAKLAVERVEDVVHDAPRTSIASLSDLRSRSISSASGTPLSDGASESRDGTSSDNLHFGMISLTLLNSIDCWADGLTQDLNKNQF